MTDPLIRNLKQRIYEAGYSDMQVFAEHCGIRPGTLTKWLQGASRPSKKSLEKLAAALDCSVEDFTAEDGRHPSDEDHGDQTIEKLKKLVLLQEQVIEKLERLLALRQ